MEEKIISPLKLQVGDRIPAENGPWIVLEKEVFWGDRYVRVVLSDGEVKMVYLLGYSDFVPVEQIGK